MADEGFKRKLTAILSADVAGYSRLMAEDETSTVKTLAIYREVVASLINQHRGRVVDSPGDNIFAEFYSVVDAVQCAVAVQNEIQVQNAELPNNRRMEFRIGINLGDVIDEEDRIYGDGVNIAARLEAMADPGGICVSKTAFDQIETKLPLGYEYLGEQSVKNMPKPVGAYRVLMKPDAAGKVIGEKRFLGKFSRKMALATIIFLVIIAGGSIGWNIYLQQLKNIEPASLEKMAFPLPDKPSIAVLPFVNMSGDPKQEHLVDGLTEEIITALSIVKNMFVIARNSTFTYKGKPIKVQQVAEELGVRYVLEGSMRIAENHIRISAQLIDAIAGHYLWAERYDRDLKDIFAVQDEITKKIITTLQVELTMGEEARLVEKGTKNLDAYLKALQALNYIYQMKIEDNVLARKACEEAIALDPDFARSYHTLGWTHLMDVYLGATESPKKSIIKALELAQKALALDSSLSFPHRLLCNVYTMMRHYEKAIEEGEKAIALDPNSADANVHFARTLIFAGRSEEAILLINKAIRLNPFAPTWYYQLLGNAYCVTDQYDEAITACKKALNIQPDNLFAHIFLAVAYASLSNEDDASNEVKEILRLNPKYSVKYFGMTFNYEDKTDKERIINSLRKAGLPE